jgi:D-glycero-D-manno-heptose 1,7-bisphosphate phosphatase
MRGQRAVFLDRDGTINEEVGYLDRIEKLRILPGTAEAIGMLNQGGMKVVVVTNRRASPGDSSTRPSWRKPIGIFWIFFADREPASTPFTSVRTTRRRAWGLPAGLCLPEAQAGTASPGRRRDGNRLEDSFMIGDMPKDVEAGILAGARGILVRTGLRAGHSSATGGAYIAEESAGCRPLDP